MTASANDGRMPFPKKGTDHPETGKTDTARIVDAERRLALIRSGVAMVGNAAMWKPDRPVYFYARRRGEFGAAVKLLGWSRLTLADRLGVSPRTARRWVDGDTLVPESAARWVQAVWLAVERVGEYPGLGHERR